MLSLLIAAASFRKSLFLAEASITAGDVQPSSMWQDEREGLAAHPARGNAAIWSTDHGRGTGSSQQVPRTQRITFPWLWP